MVFFEMALVKININNKYCGLLASTQYLTFIDINLIYTLFILKNKNVDEI